jgi:hypothetical protein
VIVSPSRHESNLNLKSLRLPNVPYIPITTDTEMDIERTGADDDAYGLVCWAVSSWELSVDEMRGLAIRSKMESDGRGWA